MKDINKKYIYLYIYKHTRMYIIYVKQHCAWATIIGVITYIVVVHVQCCFAGAWTVILHMCRLVCL